MLHLNATSRQLSQLLFLLLVTLTPSLVSGQNVPLARLVSSSEADWPQFRGPRRDGVCDERGLLNAWSPDGPKLLWTTTNLGKGYSSPVIVGDRLFLTGDRDGFLELYALDLTGRIVWQATNGASWKQPFGGSRSAVTYSGGRIYHENAHGRIACLEAVTGRELWSLDLLERFGGRNITWGLSDCLLVDNTSVYSMPGGTEALMVALDKINGTVRWKTDALLDSVGDGKPETAGYASPILVEFAGRRLIIGCSLRHVVCVDAENGKLQWTRRMPTNYAVLALMPVLVGNAVFVTAPHGDGGALMELTSPSGPDQLVRMRELWSTKLDSLQGCVVHRDGRLFGSFYSNGKGWAAVDAATGAVLYNARDFAKGSVLAADGRLYVLCEDGQMLLLEAGAAAFEVHGRFQLAAAKDRDAWAHPVINRGRLYLRYHGTLFCYEVRG
jgi:hypothetical protein